MSWTNTVPIWGTTFYCRDSPLLYPRAVAASARMVVSVQNRLRCLARSYPRLLDRVVVQSALTLPLALPLRTMFPGVWDAWWRVFIWSIDVCRTIIM